MAKIRTFATIGLLVTLGSEAAIAMSPQEIPAEVKSCKAITDDKERLKCFDGLFGEARSLQSPRRSASAKASRRKAGELVNRRDQIATDGSPEVVAANLVSDTVLILRCKDQTTEAAFSTQYNYLGYSSVDVELRINDQTPTKEVWKASMNGRAAFAPDAVAFIESLPDNGNLSIKTTRSTDGKVKEGRFNLDAVSEVRNKIAKACDWDNAPVDQPTGSVDHHEGR